MYQIRDVHELLGQLSWDGKLDRTAWNVLLVPSGHFNYAYDRHKGDIYVIVIYSQ